MNTVNLIGRLTKDPEIKYTSSGIAICKFILAVNRDFTNQNGEREADFITCTTFKKTAENLVNYQKKGSQIGVVGRIQTGSYEGQDGKRIFTTDVVVDRVEFLGSNQSNGHSNNTNVFHQNSAPVSIQEDELPF